MGEAASMNSEFCILTSDNPRSEDPESITKMVEAGMKGKKYRVILDRAEAIESAMQIARPGDIILIAGKGHETYQEFANETIAFDDRAVARRVLSEFRIGDLKERMEKAKEGEENAKKFNRGDDKGRDYNPREDNERDRR
jgi:UDP-N-acetylmuramoyl-L-alanyl-D-glutamate--2,6-diaminopimelate ligase